MDLLELHDVSFISGDVMVLQHFSVGIAKGDYVSVVGPSGGGKSTFLRLCCHLISPTAGTVFFNGFDMRQQDPVVLRKKIAYCFQTPVLFGESVIDNLFYPYRIRRIKPDIDRAVTLLDLFGLKEDYLRRPVKNLSGGEKQRIALIRTLLFTPEILLLDEVTSALDSDSVRSVERVISGLNDSGVTVLWVTHDGPQSRRHANRLLTVSGGMCLSQEVLK